MIPVKCIPVLFILFAGELRSEVTGADTAPNGQHKLKWELNVPESNGRSRVSLRQDSRELWQHEYDADADLRYFKVSWSPSSEAVLIGENYKAAMDLTLVRLKRSNVPEEKRFALGEKFFKLVEQQVPWREEIKSSAPVGRVVWKTVRWTSPSRVSMIYIYHGIGYEAAADVVIDFTAGEPDLSISKLRHTVPQSLFDEGD
ncbi:hypothetical protein ACXR0O_13895 [Verrucomicrobiota bacterium sgz303538]